jgi:hypothetical protein
MIQAVPKRLSSRISSICFTIWGVFLTTAGGSAHIGIGLPAKVPLDSEVTFLPAPGGKFPKDFADT